MPRQRGRVDELHDEIGRVAVRALALLGRTKDVASLVQAAQALVESGLIGYYHSPQTTTGIAAAAARNWEASEHPHRQPIEQVDRLPFPIAQPDTREWYARMLMEGRFGRRGLRPRAAGRAVARYDAMEMVAFAGRAARVRAATLSSP
jgi:hypothetical protein